MPRLIVIRGADEGKQFELSGPLLGLGRDASNAVRLHDTEVSRRHAECRQIEGGYCLVDVGSANGTFLNGERVGRGDRKLRRGDVLTCGSVNLVVEALHGDGATDEGGPGHRIDIRPQAGMLVIVSARAGRQVVGSRGELPLPAAARKMCGIAAGQPLLLAGFPSADLLMIHAARAVVRLLADLHAQAIGGGYVG